MTRFHSIVPVTGESVYSILSRLHVLEGSTSPLVTLKKWTGVRGYKPLSGLPTHLSKFANQLSLPDGPMRLIRAHTHFPLYAHFLSADRKKMVIEAMLKSGAPKSRVGLLRNDLGASESRRYCSSCERSDIERYGVALWHREHSFPWLMVCPEHHEWLCELFSQGQFGDRQLTLPGCGVNVQLSKNIDSETRLYYIAKQIKFLMERPKSIFISSTVYRRLLNEVGLTTRNGRVRQKRLVKLVIDWLTPLKDHLGFDRLFEGLNVERNWVAELVAGSEGFHHPVKHIILWGALRVDAYEVLNTASTFGEQLELPLGSKHPVTLTKDLIAEMVAVTGSLRKAAKIIGVDTTTLIVAADTYGIPVKRRPKKITAEQRNHIAEESKYISTSVIADKYNVSIATVNRIRRGARAKEKRFLC